VILAPVLFRHRHRCKGSRSEQAKHWSCSVGVRHESRLGVVYLRQRFGVRVPGGAPPSAQPATTAGLLVCVVEALAPGFGPRQLGDERGDCRGDGLALLRFPMSIRKEVYEEPRGHRQPGWPTHPRPAPSGVLHRLVGREELRNLAVGQLGSDLLQRSGVLGPHDLHRLSGQAFALLALAFLELESSDTLALSHGAP
jgi:hypothetical protein